MERVVIKVKAWDGCIEAVECTKRKHPSGYGNGTVVVMENPKVCAGFWMFDTRWVNFEEYGGFEGLCKWELEARGWEIVD